MLRRTTIVGAMLALLTIVMLMCLSTFSLPVRTAYAQACDPSGSVDGAANPSTVLPGQTVTFTATNFTANEEVSFWFTLPSGVVAGTAAPLCCAGPDGIVRFAPAPLPSAFYQDPGKWALTVQGSTSNHTSVIYFCVLTQPPAATATSPPPPPPATATVPPVATGTVEATATGVTTATVQPVETAVVASPTVPAQPAAPTGSITANDQVVSDNTVVVASVTAGQDGWVVVHESLPDGTMSVQGVIGKAPVTAGTHTDLRVTLDRAAVNGETVWPMLHIDNGQIGVYEFPAADPPVVVNGEVVMQPVVLTVVGMPRTGESDLTFLVLAGLVGLGLLAAGLGARRRMANR